MSIRPGLSSGWGKAAVLCLPSDRGEHGGVPAGDVHRGRAAGPDAVAAQEAEGERVPLRWDVSQHKPTGYRPKAVYYWLLLFL